MVALVRMKGLTLERHNGWRHSVCWQVVLLMGRPAEPSYRGLAAGRKPLVLGRRWNLTLYFYTPPLKNEGGVRNEL